ncbi:Glycosyltransferase involved in cell wall bisynthesis [Pseudomonas delhiensis]|uniref:Glycosyltransferase involved in cell wall bisynthesis n=1 Tax=Pseudomonas delhiensis TaxID=366289 RepID=A0A239IR62_9PSED|nr:MULTISPECIES: glycosyltransferase [Pseudomonas]SDI66038.1 Glycosyltransferase involved in cell wall bisynthesis [Pseudomonas delhiensis]SNS95563.1 Glycosyltransferase involved in cell wall bisynthesis [Pseudomonas delhiensis]
MKILIVAGDSPYPANHGGRVDIFERLKVISKTYGRENIDIIITGNELTTETNKELKKYCHGILVSPRNTGISATLSLTPFQGKSRASLKDLTPLRDQYDIMILEGDYVFPILDNPRINCKTPLLRSHNIESKYFYNLFKADTTWRKIFYLSESIKFYIQEKRETYKNIKKLYISKKENQIHGNKEYWLPTPVDVDGILERTTFPQGEDVLYIGSLFMPNNIFGLRWYLEKVHPTIESSLPNYRLHIAGNTRDHEITWLKNYKNIEIYPNASDEMLESLYNKCSLFVSPIFHGAGVKIKNINALASGIPVITTTVGNEGTGLSPKHHIFISDTPENFINTTIRLLTQKQEAYQHLQAAQNFIKEHYAAQRISHYIEQTTSSKA